MFYSQSLLTRKGPLGNIWIAAHCFKKLKRDQIDHTDIPSSVDKIMPDLQISYRILAHLLLGIVKIFSKKVEYLYCDCNEALTCIRKSFTSAQYTVTRGTVSKSRCRSVDAKAHRPDKPISSSQNSVFAESVETMRAPYHLTISIPERLELDSFDLGVPDDEDAVSVKPHEQSTPQDHCLDDPCDPYFQNKNSVFAESVETMRAPYHLTISIPERLELDSFDLGVPDDEDAVSVKPHEQSTPQDHCLDDPCDPYFQNKCTHMESIIHYEIDSSCFTPVSDVLPSHMMNIDLEFPEEYNLKSVETKEKENLQGDINVHGLLEVKQSPTPIILNEELDDQLHPLEVVKMKDSENVKNLRKPVEPVVSPEKLLPSYEKVPACISEDAIVMNPIKPHKVDPLPGVPSPNLIIKTPVREHHPALKKRKILFDGMIVLSNQAMRKGIHDPSNLVLKRKKAPHTFLDAWKSKKICNLRQHLLEPLIPCIGSKLKALFESSSHFPSTLNMPIDHDKPVDKENHINKSTELEHANHKMSTDISSPYNRTEVPTADGFSEVEKKKSSSVESLDNSLDLMDQLESQETFSTRQESGWSSRTRVVGRHLYSKLLAPQSEERSLSLLQLLKKSKRVDAARCFYEILVLKSCGSIDVNQDSPYSMILITPTEKLEAEFRS